MVVTLKDVGDTFSYIRNRRFALVPYFLTACTFRRAANDRSMIIIHIHV